VNVPFHGVDQFTLEAVSAYEEKLEESNISGTPIRALLICNPHNPLGQCYPPEVLEAYMKLCAKHRLHLIVDEVYALSCYKEPSNAVILNQPNQSKIETKTESSSSSDITHTPFHSVLRFPPNSHIPKSYLHILYGLSKDFASSGLRLGCIHSYSAPLLRSISTLTFFSWPSSLSTSLATAMLSNRDWKSQYLALSQRRLAECAVFARTRLDKMGIPHNGASASAGFFLWVDLRTWVGERGWEGERRLTESMMRERVFLTPGQSLSAEEPGYFRFCFVMEEQEISEGLKRLWRALEAVSNVDQAAEMEVVIENRDVSEFTDGILLS